MSEPAQIPTGTVTLLFTDIEGSTRLWEAEPEPMAAALRRHDEILRGCIEQAAGYVFKTVGDAFCAAFTAPRAAVAAALAAQRAIGAQAWPTSRPIRVRMSLHTGVCEERDADYFGPVVNRTARLEAVAHGGQVLLSGVTAELLAGDDGVTLTDLGRHRLKDLGRPEQVFQLAADELPASFPPLASLDNPELPNNLPTAASAFVGRERELASVRELITTERMVTLAGAGGSGKTRLALQAAAELTGWAKDGVWLAELAAVTDGSQIAPVVAAALTLPGRGETPPMAALLQALAGQDALLVLDNCEHLVDEAAKFCDEVVRHCPRVRILATSREPLGIDGEVVYRVPSMSLPDRGAGTAAELAASDAARLFGARGRLTLDDASAPLVATICRRLDGIPLALELAAARLSSMSLRQVSERLDQRFRLLTGGSRNALPRQQTLQAAVEWSFGLLNQAERETLLRLSVFAGGFELEAAEEVCATADVDAFEVGDLIGSLVDKSLLVADRDGDSVRYRLLETIRQYSSEGLLRAAGEAEVLRVQGLHAGYYVRLAETAGPGLRSREQRAWLRRLDAEWDNLRAAITYLEAEQRPADVLRVCVALRRYAVSRAQPGLLTSLRTAVQKSGEKGDLLAEALMARMYLNQFFAPAGVGQLGSDESQHDAERALAIARQAGGTRLEAEALCMLCGVAYLRGEPEQERERLAQEAEALARQAGDVHLLADVLGTIAVVAASGQSRRRHLAALDCYRRSGDDLLAANELHMLYGLDLVAGHLDDAQAHLEESVALAESLGDEIFLLYSNGDLAMLRLIQDRHAEAVPLVRRNLLAARRTGIAGDAAGMILTAACCAAWQSELTRAATLHGAADSAIGAGLAARTMLWSEAEQEMQEREQARLRGQLGETAYLAAHRDGERLTPAEAVELALGRDTAGHLPSVSSV